MARLPGTKYKKRIASTDPKDLEKELTKDQREFLEKSRTGKTDPVYFAETLLDLRLHDCQKVWLWMTTRTQYDKAFELGLTLNDATRTLWRSREEFDSILAANPDFLKNILVPSNRWGKTLVTSVKHLWYNYYKIGTRGSPDQRAKVRCGTLNISPHSNQCDAGYQYILDILFSKFVYTKLEHNVHATNCAGYDPSVSGVGCTNVAEHMQPISRTNKCLIEFFYISSNEGKRTIHFKNGTFYKAVPTGEDQASSLAGSPYLYISYDECAQSLHLKAELPAKIMSRLIDFGGPLDLVSTPEVDKPSHQYFFHVSKLGLKHEDGWFTLVGKLPDNIFLGEREVRQITGAIKSTDPAKYRQVVFGEFITTGKKMFDALTIERLWDEENAQLPLLDHKYLLVADWGFADTGDPTVFYVLDYTELLNTRILPHLRKARVVYRESIRGGSPIGVLTHTKILQREWNGAKFIHDSSSMGGVIIKKILTEMNMTDIFDFSASGDKMDMLFCLLVVMSANRQVELDPEGKVIDRNPEFGRLRSYYIPELEEQLGNYQYNPEKGVSDKRLEQDDVMALGMGIWYLERKLLKSNIKAMSFNPLAPKVEDMFPKEQAKILNIHSTTIPEKRIF